MSLRLDYRTAEPAAFRALSGLQKYVQTSELDPLLVHLIYTRTSQINGCAFCLDMHTREARESGETEQRLYTLSAWHDTAFFSDAERAALALTEAVTRISEHGVSDEIYSEVARHFTPKQITQLLVAISTINAWNRMSIASGAQPPSATEFEAVHTKLHAN